MATTTLAALGSIVSVKKEDKTLVLSIGAGERSATFPQVLAGMGIASVAFSSLPSGFVGGMLFVSDGLKATESTGAGTGVLVTWDGTNWVTVDNGSTVAN